jgi:hypothetical protein
LLLFTCSPQQLVLCSFLSLLQQLQALTAWLLQSKTDDEAMTSQHIVEGFYDEDEDDDAAAAFSLGAGVFPEDVAACQSKQIYMDSDNRFCLCCLLDYGSIMILFFRSTKSHGQHCPRQCCVLATTTSSVKYYAAQRK